MLFIIILQLVKEIFKKFNKRIEEAQCKTVNKAKLLDTIENNVYKKEQYKNYFEKTKHKLLKCGNPLNLTPLTYLILKIVCFLFAFLLTFYNGYNILFILIISVSAFFIVDLLQYLSNDDDRKKIVRDLPDIADVINIQSIAGVSIGLSLTEIYDISKIKRLRKDLSELAAEINITKNIEKSLDKFIEKYEGFYELEAFITSLKQAIQTGKSKDILRNQSLMLKESNLTNVENETKQIDNVVVMVVTFLLLLGAVLIIIYSFKAQITDSLFQMFN